MPNPNALESPTCLKIPNQTYLKIKLIKTLFKMSSDIQNFTEFASSMCKHNVKEIQHTGRLLKLGHKS